MKQTLKHIDEPTIIPNRPCLNFIEIAFSILINISIPFFILLANSILQ